MGNNIFKEIKSFSLLIAKFGFIPTLTIGTLFAGALAEVLDVGTAIIVIGIMTVVVVLLVVAFFRTLIRTE